MMHIGVMRGRACEPPPSADPHVPAILGTCASTVVVPTDVDKPGVVPIITIATIKLIIGSTNSIRLYEMVNFPVYKMVRFHSKMVHFSGWTRTIFPV